MALLSPEHYPQIRALIDLSLTAEELPAATIALPVYLGAAEAEIRRRDPQWATRTGDARTALMQAVMHYAAGLLAPALPSIRSESYPEGYSYDREAVDYAGRGAALLARAGELIDSVTAPEELSALRPPTFAVARGRRGRW